MSKASEIIGRLNNFCNEIFAIGTTRAQILAYFSGLDEIRLPFPSSLVGHRFHLMPDSKEFFYSGRCAFQELMMAMDSDNVGLRLLGTAGSGKSYLLAAYATYLYCLSRRFPDDERVVYISSCNAAGGSMLYKIALALQVALPEDALLRNMNLRGSDEDLQTSLRDAVSRNNHRQLIFIFDDWNYLLRTPEEYCALRLWVVRLAANHQRIEAISTHGPQGWRGFYSKKTLDLELLVPPGLSDVEWAVWRTSPRLPLFSAAHTPDDADMRHYTGLVPGFLARLCSYGADSFEQAMHAFQSDDHAAHLSGASLTAAISEFCDSVEEHKLREFARTTRNAISEVSQDDLDCTLYDNRFLTYDFRRDMLNPLNGYISSAIVEVMARSKRMRGVLFEALRSPQWLLVALSCGQSITQSVSLGLFALADFILSHNLSIDQVVRFEGDYPLYSQLSSADGLVLYWPRSWIQRSASYVTRMRVTERVKQGRRYVSVTKTTITAHQVAMTGPADHARTRDFFERNRPPAPSDARQHPLPDCRQYELVDERATDIRFVLNWVLPNTIPSWQRKRLATIQVQSLENVEVTQKTQVIFVG